MITAVTSTASVTVNSIPAQPAAAKTTALSRTHAATEPAVTVTGDGRTAAPVRAPIRRSHRTLAIHTAAAGRTSAHAHAPAAPDTTCGPRKAARPITATTSAARSITVEAVAA